MQILIKLLFWFLAVIHFLPALALFAPPNVWRLYGVPKADRTLVTLLQHRALLLGLLGGAFMTAAYVEALRWPVVIGGAISMVAFLIIAAKNRELSGPLKKIAIVDATGVLAVFVLIALLNSPA